MMKSGRKRKFSTIENTQLPNEPKTEITVINPDQRDRSKTDNESNNDSPILDVEASLGEDGMEFFNYIQDNDAISTVTNTLHASNNDVPASDAQIINPATDVPYSILTIYSREVFSSMMMILLTAKWRHVICFADPYYSNL